MEILNLSLPAANRFATGYLEGSSDIQNFFHYDYKNDSDYIQRLDELTRRKFYRQELADHIKSFMSKFPHSAEIEKNIDKLRLDNSVAVIGGQQAGLLTGPLYSVHKVISIIKLAQQKERELGIPVVPIFWIAGEDHDYQEVNHVYVLKNNKPEKWIYPEKNLEKKMVTDIPVNKETCLAWVEEIIETFGETNHTNHLRQFAKTALTSAEELTFVDFFASMIMEMFKESGLLIVDSGNKGIRKLEKEFFTKMIRDHAEITSSVLAQQQKVDRAGFRPAIDIGEDAANLFYYDELNNERLLLQFDSQAGVFTARNGDIQFSMEELLEIASEYPEFLSNNVVTRPLMQEWLFPTLAFIGGPGEIAYWAELKQVFEHFQIKMPLLVPRLNITILDRSVETDLAELNLELQAVLESGTERHQMEFIDSLRDKELDDIFDQVRQTLSTQYGYIHSKVEHLDKGLLPLVKKNEDILHKQISFMEKKIDEAVCRKHDAILKKFTRVENALRPGGSPQERVWNPFYYLNQYGTDFISELLQLEFTFDGMHKVIKM
ncbi:bacillithiol biosynthesis cysteine-adding enzyme BshC [Mesobacillus foraminis]|uniref:bacillithiol biosynthesis cysteine-adding enzyme BshC n=1 Tax=Mesobacillus foraminis TaxID=279826 RepID=UPI001BE93EB4|nr:bacillithiol biosynthesis cysteine-adding enzyme BshC [Mesobacillus foraminis]MBT2756118.1 bacillithiol biosynthesis cysteine-adding enzyme BshC [Mesobacillus foraminis]